VKLDRETAKALVDAGYMPLSEYLAELGDLAASPVTVPPADPGEHRLPNRRVGPDRRQADTRVRTYVPS
jgi:hypothetical protein